MKTQAHINQAFILGVALSLIAPLHAQITVSAGGDTSGSGGSISYSLGQIATGTSESSSGSLSEGIQQAFEIYRISGTDDIIATLDVVVYPNPVSSSLRLSVALTTPGEISASSYHLLDTKGKLLKKSKLTGDETIIDMDDYLPGIYFIEIVSKNNVLKSFKIVKK